ncbi:c-type cytochrome [Ramlibacter sp. RBP-2]|uniref:C-type cytochrome n=1 Tax=Ramlibacter lithotrophicus TaxID=2606681 RepID=A0A7X6DK38_9BURK|nr:c-type cytochrome [Ramlibacter lithotrophicus]NKE68610.1 c-type cytochrome [Ramlibacter lithotrophicus]
MKWKAIVFGALVLAAVVASGLYSLRATQPAPGIALQPGNATVVQRGATVYRAHCAACHGAQLQGQPNWRERGADGLLPAPPHDASGHTWHHPDEVLFRLTKHGIGREARIPDYKTAMPVYEGVLGDADIIAVLSWIKAQWPADIRERQERIDAEHRRARAGG